MAKKILITTPKGGVTKTGSSINIAYTLAKRHNKKVLLVDIDEQGNSSKFFDLYNYESIGMYEVLTYHNLDIRNAIQATKYEELDIITANLSLQMANKEVMLDVSKPQQTRIKKKLQQIEDQYDYIIMDGSGSFNMAEINALVAADYVISPIKLDRFVFDGMDILMDQIEDFRDFNENLKHLGCFITLFNKRTKAHEKGMAQIEANTQYGVFKTMIRPATKFIESTYVGRPLLDFSPKSNSTIDYISLVDEILQAIE